MSAYRFGIDVGGTFTDLLAFDEQAGALLRYKVSSTPQAPEEGALHALQAFFHDQPDAPVSLISHSTTLATNALLGQLHLDLPRLALITTAGFRDVLEIGRQGRAEVYNLFVRRPPPLVARRDRFGVRERLDARGVVVEPLDEAALRGIARELSERGIRHAAICFLHAYQNPVHERRARQVLLEQFPGLSITLSSEVDPEEREYERASTTVMNALLAPIVRDYLQRLETAQERREAALFIMQSNGGVSSAAQVMARPATIIESGPASGVIGAAHLGKLLGIERLLSFDMGGTTAKAGMILDGMPQVVGEFEAAGRTHSGRAVRGSGYPVRFPFIDLAEVSAGGGTIAWIDGAGAVRVGPQSAGADPGPVCYGKGAQEPTVTDAHLVLGRLNPGQLAGGAVVLSRELAEDALAQMAGRIAGFDSVRLAAGIIRLINADMAKVLRIVSLERGHDPRLFTLVAFGGAGPLHACALADELALPRILIPPQPGLFSAWGLLVADHTHTELRSILASASACRPDQLEGIFKQLEAKGQQALAREQTEPGQIAFRRKLEMRYMGQSFDLTLPAPALLDASGLREVQEAFHVLHEQTYGYGARDNEIELVAARLEAIVQSAKPAPPAYSLRHSQPDSEAQVGERPVFFDESGAFHATPIYQRERLLPGNIVSGPAIIEQYDTTTMLPPGWKASVDRLTNLVLERSGGEL
ncbi:MAG TPA: hydantoinase/oxoprolinase family protein [Ktedonobacterales bacterium]|jgi:N-methylhydantoinase A